MRRIIYITLILTSIGQLCLHAQSGAVSKPLSFRIPYEEYVRNYIETQAEAWVKWDRNNETSEQYEIRVSEENKNRKHAEWEAEADSIYKQKYLATVDWKNFKLIGKYDPQKKTIKIGSELFGDFVLYIPKEDSASAFVAQFDQREIGKLDFGFSDDDMVILNSITFVLPSLGERFTYNRHEQPDLFVQTGNKEESIASPKTNQDDIVIQIEPTPPTDDGDGGSDVYKDNGLNVDTIIPQMNRINNDVYGVIIGNENYTYEVATRFSNNDATIFYEYCVRTLGIPPSNLLLQRDATYGEMLSAIQFLRNAAIAKNGNIRVLFYFSGHGMSDLNDNSMYLLPADCSSKILQAALKAETLYKELSDMKPLSATVFLDACFSGKSGKSSQSDKVELLALMDIRGIEIKPRESSLYGNLVVFSATTDAEVAYTYESEKHGLFTYFLLKKLQLSGGDVTYDDLADFLVNHVKSKSFDLHNQIQTPKVRGSHDVTNVWHGWKLIK